MLQRFPAGPANSYQFHPKEAANVKAEMIRRNLLSRKDLMHLYRPPLKMAEIPQNNPFFSGQFVERRPGSQMNKSYKSESQLPRLNQINKSLYGSNFKRATQTAYR